MGMQELDDAERRSLLEWSYQHHAHLDGDNNQEPYFLIWPELDEIIGESRKRELLNEFVRCEYGAYGPLAAAARGAYLRSFFHPKKRAKILRLDEDLWNKIKTDFIEAIESTRMKYEALLLSALPQEMVEQLKPCKSGYLTLHEYSVHPLSAFVELSTIEPVSREIDDAGHFTKDD